MDVLAVGFWGFFASSVILLAALGGQNGKRFSFACVAATIATFIANSLYGFGPGQPLIALIDLALLGYGLMIALKSNVFWPIWFCGFHFITVSGDIAKLTFPADSSMLYINLAGFWAIPALGAAVIGVVRDWRMQTR